MWSLPSRFAPLIVAFSSLFGQRRTWHSAQLLLIGAILAPGVRTVTSVLRVMGHRRDRHFVTFHRVLNRARWNARHASRLLLGLLLDHLVPDGPIVLGLDDTIERRRGKRIRAKGIYRDPVRSSHAHFVKASGLRWLSVMLLAPVPWARRVWALPFLTALAPSERADVERGHRHKRLTEVARQLLLQTHRWLQTLAPGRHLIVVADSSFAALEFLAALAPRMTCITRFRLDAALYAPAPPRVPGTNGRPRKKGGRCPTLAQVLADPTTTWRRVRVPAWYRTGPREIELATGTAVWYHSGLPVLPIRWVLVRDPHGRFDPQALLATQPALDAVAIVRYFVHRWQVEVTFEETRRHLGLETQRQWSDRAIARTTPVLLALFSLVTLLAGQLPKADRRRVRQAAWYQKTAPTFSDTLAAVRWHCWREMGLSSSAPHAHKRKPSPAMLARLTDALCYAA